MTERFLVICVFKSGKLNRWFSSLEIAVNQEPEIIEACAAKKNDPATQGFGWICPKGIQAKAASVAVDHQDLVFSTTFSMRSRKASRTGSLTFFRASKIF